MIFVASILVTWVGGVPKIAAISADSRPTNGAPGQSVPDYQLEVVQEVHFSVLAQFARAD